MDLDILREQVLDANLALVANGLVTLTWGNVSGIDRSSGRIAIKPSGVPYDAMTAADLVIVGLDGTQVASERRPSTDTPTHLALYRTFREIGAIVHSHSPWATSWAQAEREIPVLGTTHADLCAIPIPLTRALTDDEVRDDYEGATGLAIAEAIGGAGADELPCVLVRGHGPFCWGATPHEAVENAVILEAVARLAALTFSLDPLAVSIPPAIRNKHFTRKHGAGAYYGQPRKADTP